MGHYKPLIGQVVSGHICLFVVLGTHLDSCQVKTTKHIFTLFVVGVKLIILCVSSGLHVV